MRTHHQRQMSDQAHRACETVAHRFYPDVQGIAFYLSEDHSGEAAVFFNCLLSNAAGDEFAADSRARRGKAYEQGRVFEMMQRAQAALVELADPSELGWGYYFSWRTVRECKNIGEDNWPFPKDGVPVVEEISPEVTAEM